MSLLNCFYDLDAVEAYDFWKLLQLDVRLLAILWEVVGLGDPLVLLCYFVPSKVFHVRVCAVLVAHI